METGKIDMLSYILFTESQDKSMCAGESRAAVMV